MNLKPSAVAVIASVAMGTVLLGVSLAVLLLRDQLSPELALVTRGMFALGAGGVSGGILGTIEVGGGFGKFTVKALGPIAITVLFYLASPVAVLQRYI